LKVFAFRPTFYLFEDESLLVGQAAPTPDQRAVVSPRQPSAAKAVKKQGTHGTGFLSFSFHFSFNFPAEDPS
jgi:hypothetical protein